MADQTDLESAQSFARKLRIVISGFAMVMVLAGMVGLVTSLHSIYLSKVSARWIHTKAEIITSEMSQYESQSGNSSTSKITMYKPHIVYRYQVDGKTYEHDRIAFVPISASDTKPANAYLNRYPEGKQVDIYYPDGTPQNSVIEAGEVNKVSYGGLGASLTFLLMGWWLFRKRYVMADPQFFVKQP